MHSIFINSLKFVAGKNIDAFGHVEILRDEISI